MIEKLVEIGILYDYYGNLLSHKQSEVIELFYNHDLSLAEIGENLNITRQGVFDTLKRAEANLYEYEQILGLIKRFKDKDNDIQEIINSAKYIRDTIGEDNEYSKEVRKKAELIQKLGQNILNNS